MVCLLKKFVPVVPVVQIVQTPSFILPRDAGEEKRWGLERSLAVELSEAVKRIELLYPPLS